MSSIVEGAAVEATGITWLPPDESARVPRNAARVRRPRHWEAILVTFLIGGLTAVLAVTIVAPAVRQARKQRCAAHLKQIGQALAEYQSTHGRFPAAAIGDGQGRLLLSWRVAILPQLGYSSLYDRFRRDEPWDSPHNRALLAEMPPEFACPALEDGRRFVTGYQAVVGPKPELGSIGTLFEWARGIEIREVIDGTSNTVAVIETKRPIPWTQPDDPPFDRDSPLPDFASGHPGGYHVLLADGAVRFLKATIIPQTLRALITRDGNEVLGGG